MSIKNQSVTDTLVYSDNAGNNQIILVFSDTLAFTEYLETHAPKGIGTDTLTITDTAYVSFSGHKSFTDTLTFTDNAVRARPGYVTDTLTISDSYLLGESHPYVIDTLSFNETIVSGSGGEGSDDLAFSETVVVRFAKKVLIVSDTLSFTESATGFIPSALFVNKAIPGEPGGPVDILYLPTIAPTTTVTFSYNSYFITLRAPDFGNKDSIKATRIQRTTRGGDLIIYRDPLWSRSETFELDFSWITDTDAAATQLFIQESLGCIVTYTDFEGNVFTGIIQTPQLDIKKTGLYNNTFTITFEVVPG